MFRRRDDEEEGSANQGSLLGGSDSVKVIPPETSSPFGAPAQPSHPASPLSATYPVSSPAPRTEAPAPRATATSGGSASFRGTAATAETPRNRQEAKGSGFGAAAAAPAAERSRDSRRVLTVGSDILLKGEIATCDRLVIEGKVDAVLNDVGTVELAESGSFKGVAQVENAEISGLFEGELVVKGRLVIYASGRVRGKITYGEIEIERGGELTGEIKTMASANAARATNGGTKIKEKAEAA